ncbi:MAG: ATP-binding protein, partial [Deferrisomatales bacterium]
GQRAAREIVRAADRAAGLTRQLLAFSRRQVVEPRAVDVNEAVRLAAEMLERILGEDIELRLALAPGAGAVRADPTQLEQVLLNLAVNARDAMASGGTLTVSTRCEGPTAGEAGEFCVIEVADTGSGIDPGVLEHIFEPFFTTKGEGKGSGLGLATVYGIATQAGGRVAVRSEPGQGATFTVFWPRVSGAANGTPPPTPAPACRPGRGEVVVLVEDEAAVRAVAAEHLEAQGYAVVVFPSGDQADRALPAIDRVDLLVTDVVMPGIWGLELARRARARWPRLPVLFASGHTGDELLDLGGEGERNSFLQKPFRLAQLEAAVRDALDRWA